MRRLTLGFLLSVVMGLMVFGGLSENVQAKVVDPEDSDSVVISGSGGIFYPFQGQAGFNGVIQAMGILSPQERLGVELEFRNYETEFFKAKDIDTQSYILRGIGQYFFRAHGISPYVGLGLNIAVNVLDEKEFEKQRPSTNLKQEVGIGYGVIGVMGVEVPMGQRVAFFAEGRVSADFQLIRYENQSGKDKVNLESLSGLAGMGGIRFRF
ncbi:MAG: hypothetical protein E4H32_09295 [Nitrospirales bacterium]|jgi:hypothetical protein|nr:MAG: hypothetical protein E4H32_09295 [Nitrospirales bacterium]